MGSSIFSFQDGYFGLAGLMIDVVLTSCKIINQFSSIKLINKNFCQKHLLSGSPHQSKWDH